MFALYLPGGAYSWLLIAHHSSVSLLGSLTLALGPVAMYVLLCLINFSTPEEADETDVGANFEEKYPRTQTQEQIAAFINLLVSFGLGLLLLIFVSAITLLYYPRRDMMLAEDTEQKGPSRGFWLLSVGLMMRRYHMVSSWMIAGRHFAIGSTKHSLNMIRLFFIRD